MDHEYPDQDPTYRRLLDENDIRRLIARFARCLDERRWADYAALYSENAVLLLPDRQIEGRGSIEECVEADLGRYVATHHAGGHTDIEFDGDRASVRATLLATHVTSQDGRSHWTGGGWYRMELQKNAGGWLFTLVQPQPMWLDDQRTGPGPAPTAAA